MKIQKTLEMLKSYNLTDFQKKVFVATAQIPRGETRTYKQIAETIGHPRAVRAVGSALKINPLAPAIPCHRVVKTGGMLGNYSGFGGQ